MHKYESGGLKATKSKGSYSLGGPATETSQGREVWFGGINIRKNYVSYYLMAVYMFPDLLPDLSPELKRRMQGKSCFNFKTTDPKLFQELAQLTDTSYKRYKKEKLVK
jgi:hypothetical protein